MKLLSYSTKEPILDELFDVEFFKEFQWNLQNFKIYRPSFDRIVELKPRKQWKGVPILNFLQKMRTNIQLYRIVQKFLKEYLEMCTDRRDSLNRIRLRLITFQETSMV